MLALGSALVAWSLLLALLGFHALDFTMLGFSVASQPGPFVIDGVAVSVVVALVGIAPIAALGIVGGAGLWLEWSSPRLALLACTAWLALGVILLVAGGDWGMIATAGLLLALSFSGAWARRSEGATPLDLFVRGE